MITRSEYQNQLREANGLVLNEGTFNFLRMAAELGFPALIALYITLSETWNWGYQTEITATLVGLNVFIGVVVKIFRYRYDKSIEKYDGAVVVNQTDPMKSIFALEFNESPAQIPEMKEIRMKVVEDA